MRRVVNDSRNEARENAMMVNYIHAMVAQGTRSEWIDQRADDYTPDCPSPCKTPLPRGYPCACADWEKYQAL